VKGTGITGNPAIARDLGLCSRTYPTLRLSITASNTETLVSLGPLDAIRLGGELLDGVMLAGDLTRLLTHDLFRQGSNW
jgi:hypothetical protein